MQDPVSKPVHHLLSLHEHMCDTCSCAYEVHLTAQVRTCPAIDKRLLGASQSHQSDVFESVQDAGSMSLTTQTSRILTLLTKPLAMPCEHERGCIFLSTQWQMEVCVMQMNLYIWPAGNLELCHGRQANSCEKNRGSRI